MPFETLRILVSSMILPKHFMLKIAWLTWVSLNNPSVTPCDNVRSIKNQTWMCTYPWQHYVWYLSEGGKTTMKTELVNQVNTTTWKTYINKIFGAAWVQQQQLHQHPRTSIAMYRCCSITLATNLSHWY